MVIASDAANSNAPSAARCCRTSNVAEAARSAARDEQRQRREGEIAKRMAGEELATTDSAACPTAANRDRRQHCRRRAARRRRPQRRNAPARRASRAVARTADARRKSHAATTASTRLIATNGSASAQPSPNSPVASTLASRRRPANIATASRRLRPSVSAISKAVAIHRKATPPSKRVSATASDAVDEISDAERQLAGEADGNGIA